MSTSTKLRPASNPTAGLLDSLRAAARLRFASDAQWARASGVPRETLSRLGARLSCDSRTLWALAEGAGCSLAAVPAAARAGGDGTVPYDRDCESSLLDLCASGGTDPDVWRARGSGFFMGGLAALLAGASGFDRERYLRLAESLHVGVTTPEVFDLWLKKSPLRAARFLPMLRARMSRAAAHAAR